MHLYLITILYTSTLYQINFNKVPRPSISSKSAMTITIFGRVPIARQPAGVSLVSNTTAYRFYPIPINNPSQFTSFGRKQNILQVEIWVRQNELSLRFLCVISRRREESVDEESQKSVYSLTEQIIRRLGSC